MGSPLTRPVGMISPPISDTLLIDGVPVADTSDWTNATISMRAVGSSDLVLDAEPAILDDTAGITYTPEPADVATAGHYLIWFNADDENGDPYESPEQLLWLTGHPPTDGSADLCELADVRALVEVPGRMTGRDNLIGVLITTASARICERWETEFAPAQDGLTRRFRVTPGDGVSLVNLAPYTLRGTPTSVHLHPESGSPVTLASFVDYVRQPIQSPTDTYAYLEVSALIPLVSSFSIRFGYALVDVNGNWGYATVPEVVKNACARTVAAWIAPAMTYGIGSADDPQLAMALRDARWEMPLSAVSMLDNYKRWMQ